MSTRRQLETEWTKAKQRMVHREKPPLVLFDRRHRIALLWELFFVALVILFVVCLIAGVR